MTLHCTGSFAKVLYRKLQLEYTPSVVERKDTKMLKLIGLVTVVYFAWSWGVISAVAYVAASILRVLV